MPYVRRRHNHIRPVQRCRLRRQYHIAVKCRIGCRWPTLLTSIGPVRCGLAHGIGRNRQVIDLSDKFVEPRNTSNFVRPNQFATNLVVGNFRDYHGRAAGYHLIKPVPTFRSLS